MHIQFITTGGTIDKIYFDALSQFEVGDSQVKAMLTDALVDFSYEITAIMKRRKIAWTSPMGIEPLSALTLRRASTATSSSLMAPIRCPKPQRRCAVLKIKRWC